MRSILIWLPAALVLLTTFSVRAADTGHYEKIADADCSVWIAGNDRRFGHWSGNCREGRTEGQGLLTGEWRDDKGRWRPFQYQGPMAAGRRTGFGRTRPEGTTEYTGQYRNDRPEGWGLLRSPDGATYEGQFHQGVEHGIGTLTGKDGIVLRGRWVNGELTGPRQRQAADASWWTVFDLKADGTARGVIDRSSEVEAGEYTLVDDRIRKNGLGVYYWPTINKIYLGEFTNDVPAGTGAFVLPNKDNPADANVFSGTFDNGCHWRGDWYTAVLVPPNSCKRR